MAFQAVKGTATSTADIVFQLKEALKAVGWTIPRSGDTVSYDNTGADLITSAAVLATARAWFECRHPSGLYSFTFQYGTTNLIARVKVAFNGDAFTAGAPDRQTTGATPTATDEWVTLGAGTDAAPTYTNFCANVNALRYNFSIENVAPFRFFAMSKTVTEEPSFASMFDTAKEGSYDPLDISPYIAYWNGQSNVAWSTTELSGSSTNPLLARCPVAWIGKGIVGGTLSRVLAITLTRSGSSTKLMPGSAQANPTTGNLRVVAAMYGRPNATFTAPRMTKCVSSTLLWPGSTSPVGVSVGALVGARLTLNGANFVVFNTAGVAVPWDGSLLNGDESGGAEYTAEALMILPGDEPVPTGSRTCRTFKAVDESCGVFSPVQRTLQNCPGDD